MLRILARLIGDTVVVAAALFAAAGTLDWPRAWTLLAVLFVVRTLSAIAVHRVNSALLRERATVLIHREQPWADRIVLLAFIGTAFIGVPAVAAFDVFHWRVLPAPPPFLATLGL